MLKRSIRCAVVACLATLTLLSCGGSSGDDASGSNTDPTSEPTTSETSESPTPTQPAFDVQAWKQSWDAQSQAYGDALSTWSSQVNYLLDLNASDQQIAAAVKRLSKDVAVAGRKWIAALDRAKPIPADRADVQKATKTLRDAVDRQGEAYGKVAACGVNTKCQNKALPLLQATTGMVGAALEALPAA